VARVLLANWKVEALKPKFFGQASPQRRGPFAHMGVDLCHGGPGGGVPLQAGALVLALAIQTPEKADPPPPLSLSLWLSGNALVCLGGPRALGPGFASPLV
jgi:hypothetical protein